MGLRIVEQLVPSVAVSNVICSMACNPMLKKHPVFSGQTQHAEYCFILLLHHYLYCGCHVITNTYTQIQKIKINARSCTLLQLMLVIWFHYIWNVQSDDMLYMYILYNQRNATYSMFFIIISALHVSGGFSAHHQELIKLYVQPWVLSCFPAAYYWCGWVGTTQLHQ